MNVATKGLWYIEANLRGDLSAESIADAVGVSRFQLTRTFATSVGQPGDDILSIALGAGYGSHEAFTRTFATTSASHPGGSGCGEALQTFVSRSPFAWT